MTTDSAPASPSASDDEPFYDFPPASAPLLSIPQGGGRPAPPPPAAPAPVAPAPAARPPVLAHMAGPTAQLQAQLQPPSRRSRGHRRAGSAPLDARQGPSGVRAGAGSGRGDDGDGSDREDGAPVFQHANRKGTSLKLFDLRSRTSADQPLTSATPTSQIARRASRKARGGSKSSSSSLQGALNFVKVRAHGKKTLDFANLVKWQTVAAHQGPILALKASPSGEYLATAGQDLLIKIWRLIPPTTPRQRKDTSGSLDSPTSRASRANDIFVESNPIRVLPGHQAEILDLSWSRNSFLLSSSKDRTARLWHPQNETCLHVFQHTDEVTTVTFHPCIESKFITGSMGGHVRLWSIYPLASELCVAQVEDIVTTSTINRDGNTVIIGTYGGRAKFFSLTTDSGEWTLRNTTHIEVRSRRGKNAEAKKITGINFLPNDDKFLVSSNDSRLRLYRSNDNSIVCKFSGHTAMGSNFKASFSENGRYVLIASEDRSVYIWETSDALPTQSKQRDRTVPHEAFQPHDGSRIAAATFVPTGGLDIGGADSPGGSGLVILTASVSGEVCVFQNIGCSDE